MFFKIRLNCQLIAGCLFVVMTFAAVSFAMLKAKINVTNDQVINFFGTNKVKLVFVNGDSLYFVDFSDVAPSIKCIVKATQKPKVPVISPNGKYSTFATSEDNGGGKSSAYICSLAANATPYRFAVDTGMSPRFVQNSANLEVVYSTGTILNAARIYTNGKTYKKSLMPVSGGFAEGSAMVLANPGSYYAGLSYDNRYLGAGEIGGHDATMLDLTTNVRNVVSLYHLKEDPSANGIFGYNTSACNTSISSSRNFPNTLMFFDNGRNSTLFNSIFTSPVLPNNWNPHQIIFIQRYDSEMLKIFCCPETPTIGSLKAAWQNPEWSNHPYFATAALSIQRYKESGDGVVTGCENLMAINLKDSIYLNLIQATDTASSEFTFTDMRHPWLWVDTGVAFKEDTAWLKYDYWDTRKVQADINARGSQAIKKSVWKIGAFKIVLDNFTIRADAEIELVTFFTARGNILGTFSPEKTMSVSLNAWRKRYPGVAMVKVVCRNETQAVFRLLPIF